MKPRVYAETSVISYLTARETDSLVGASRQLLTRRWWARREACELLISEVVLRECRAGDGEAARRRLAAVEGLSMLGLTPAVAELAVTLIDEAILPAMAAEDALHIALAAVHRVDFLLSWNFRHIANPVIQVRIAERLKGLGMALPLICAPEALLGDDDE